MATYTKTGTTGNDVFSFATFTSSKPQSGNIYNLNGGAGTDTFYFASGTSSYLSSFSSTKFTIQPVNASGVIVVSGASNGGTTMTFNLTSVETLVFGDKSVSLSYVSSTPSTPPANNYAPVLTVDNATVAVSKTAPAGPIAGADADATDADAGATITFSLVSPPVDGSNQPLFSIDSSTGQVSLTAAGHTAIGSAALSTTYALTVKASDGLASHDQTASITISLTADSTPPTVVSFAPASGTTGVAVSDNIVVKFSESISGGSGTIEIHSGSATGAVVESYDPLTSANISISGDTLTIDPTADLANGTDYYVTFADGSVLDLASNHYAGTSAYHFSTVAAAASASGSSSGGGAGIAVAGIAGMGLLAWALL